MRKLTAVLLSAAMLLVLCTQAFAAGTLTHRLSVDGAASVTVKTGDLITVKYAVGGSKFRISQDEIYYDHGFFRLVSLTAENANYSPTEQVKTGGRHFLYFNTIQMPANTKDMLTVGSFTLEVLGTSGQSTVKNTSLRGYDANGGELTCVGENLTVQIAGTPVETTYFVNYSADKGGSVTGSVTSGSAVKAGTVVNLTATPADGYSFSGWNDGVSTASRTITVNAAINLTARFAAVETKPGGGGGGGGGFIIPAVIPASPSARFTDLQQDSWYTAGIDYCISNGLMNGTGDNTFSPDAATTRATIVTILYRLAGMPGGQGKRFADVSGDTWYSAAVAWASANGIVNGYENGLFGPNDVVTREQMAAILCRYAAYAGKDVSQTDSLAAFSDRASASDYARGAMQWAVGSGLLQGSDGKLNPTGSATRAQAATIFQRFCA